jgi:hypothetical protein
MWPIKSLQLHVANACNLSCASCSHYANQGHKGNLSVEDADRWMSHWAGRVNPKDFSLLGGEPTINPDLTAFVHMARRHFPHSQVRVVTNGFLLDRHPELPLALKAIGNARLDISIHHGSWQYGAMLGQQMQLAQHWARTHGIHVNIKESFKSWRIQYRGYGAEMAPFEDHDAKASWDNCQAKQCFQLLDGDIWKCPPLAYLPMQHARYGLSEKWAPYLKYKPLPPCCTDQELQAFFLMTAEPYCEMCPAKVHIVDKPWPVGHPGRG